VGFIGWVTLLICLCVGATSFFSVNSIALRVFSRVRLQEAFKTAAGEERPELVDKVVQNADRLILACAFYRLVFNMGALLLMVALMGTLHTELTPADYLIAFVASLAIFSVFSLAIPYAWAKYAGETLISRTYWILAAFTAVAAPIMGRISPG